MCNINKHVFLLKIKILGIFIFSVLLCPLAIAATDNQCTSQYTPWFTGPLISPNAFVPLPGHFLIQPYLLDSRFNYVFDDNWHSHSTPTFNVFTPITLISIGIIDRLGFFILPQMEINTTQGRTSANINDLPLGLDYQIIKNDNPYGLPLIKLGARVILPIGKYQNLDPDKFATDSTGMGSVGTNVNLIFQKLFHLTGTYYLRNRLSFLYTYYSPTHVEGFNTYGGGVGTNGRVYPGSIFTAIFASEFSLNQNWVISLDTQYNHTNTTTFNGQAGFSSPGILNNVGGPSRESISFAPALEYNLSDHAGFIGGVWFAALGRNTMNFQNVAISFYYNN